ncbi:zinc finger BED domain-containing protein 4-like [Haliotis cracherodii]|uniref:zinc finger BED domain-containing protein 4-like n=1 Tax=Haliotis cracherodii TaxID=6455 RepID=UPI0039ED0DB4
MVQGQESKEDVEGFHSPGPCFCLGNMRVVYWSIVLQETDTLDNASNMSVAARVTGYPHIKCFAHTLQLAVNDGLKLEAIDNLIIHARKLVSFFSKSLVDTQELEDVQKKLGKDIRRLITDVPTRWNSIYYMFERLIYLHTDVVTVLHDEKFKKHTCLNLKDRHWALMEHLVPALKPLVSSTEVLCGEDFPTSAGVYPLVFALIRKHLVPAELDTKIVSDLKLTIKQGLQSRLQGTDFHLTAAMLATAVDLCFKHLRFLDEDLAVRKHLVDKMKQPTSSSHEPEPEEVTEQLENAVDANAVVVKQEEDLPPPRKKPTFSENQRAMNFLLGDIIDIDEDTDTCRSEEIAKLAKSYLSIPGTSVPSERAFSMAGLTITHNRAKILPQTADAIIFLNKNLSKVLKKPTISDASPSTSAAAADVSFCNDAPSIKTEPGTESTDTQHTDTPMLPALPLLGSPGSDDEI